MKNIQSLFLGVSDSRSVLCMIVVLSLCAFPLHASAQHKPVTTDELTQQADLIVVGKVAGLKAGWNTDRSRIFTTVTLAVDQTLKGDAGAGSVTILVPGGEVDGVGELYSHTAQFKKDEEVVVFAKKDKQGRLRTTGGENGKLSVRKDATTGISLVSGETALDEFTRKVRNAAGSQKK